MSQKSRGGRVDKTQEQNGMQNLDDSKLRQLNAQLKKELFKLENEMESNLFQEKEKLEERCNTQIENEVKHLSMRYANDDELIVNDMMAYIKQLEFRTDQLNKGVIA